MHIICTDLTTYLKGLWLRSTVVERRAQAGKLSLSHDRLAANG